MNRNNFILGYLAISWFFMLKTVFFYCGHQIDKPWKEEETRKELSWFTIIVVGVVGDNTLLIQVNKAGILRNI